MRIRTRSSAFAFRFFSLKSITPQANDTITEPLLIRDTTEIMESGWLRAVKYAKSAADMKIDINGMAHVQWNGVVLFLLGYHIMAQITPIITSWYRLYQL